MKRLAPYLLVLSLAIPLTGCAVARLLRVCSTANPCDARPASHKRKEKPFVLEEGMLIFVWDYTTNTPRMYVVRGGKLVRAGEVKR